MKTFAFALVSALFATSVFAEEYEVRPQGRFVSVPVRVVCESYDGDSFDRNFNFLLIYRDPVNAINYKSAQRHATSTFERDVMHRLPRICFRFASGEKYGANANSVSFRYGEPTFSDIDPRPSVNR